MYRVCIEKATGKLIEMQSGGNEQKHLDTLTNNAINAGYKAEDIETKLIDAAEWAVIHKEINKVDKEKKYIEKLVSDRLFDFAVALLKSEGKLTPDGKIPK